MVRLTKYGWYFSVLFLLWQGADQPNHILQSYFTGTGAIMWLPQCQWSNSEGYENTSHMNPYKELMISPQQKFPCAYLTEYTAAVLGLPLKRSFPLCGMPHDKVGHIDGLVQERFNSTADAMQLRLSCTKLSIWYLPSGMLFVILIAFKQPHLGFVICLIGLSSPINSSNSQVKSTVLYTADQLTWGNSWIHLCMWNVCSSGDWNYCPSTYTSPGS